jgi:hypothetical protein
MKDICLSEFAQNSDVHIPFPNVPASANVSKLLSLNTVVHTWGLNQTLAYRACGKLRMATMAHVKETWYGKMG